MPRCPSMPQRSAPKLTANPVVGFGAIGSNPNRAANVAPQPILLAFLRRCAPPLRLLVALGVAVERALEVRQRNDEAGPAVDEAALEDVEPDERPQAVSQCAPHRGALARLRLRAERRVEIGLVENFLQRAEREMPQHVERPAGRPVTGELVVLVGERRRVAEHALAEELRRAVVAMPAGAAD